jgi:hypothetical protein
MLQWGLVAVCRFKCGCVERRNILDWLAEKHRHDERRQR